MSSLTEPREKRILQKPKQKYRLCIYFLVDTGEPKARGFTHRRQAQDRCRFCHPTAAPAARCQGLTRVLEPGKERGCGRQVPMARGEPRPGPRRHLAAPGRSCTRTRSPECSHSGETRPKAIH